MDKTEYLDNFKLEEEPDSTRNIRIEALKNALEIRKFEIDLYWKRTAYFWAFIVLTFTAYFAILTHDKELDALTNELLLLSSALGLFMSICWFCVNKASKYWQENWEKHVDWLEDDVMGPLYKLILVYGKGKSGMFCPLKPYPFSVSKINQLLSFAICLVWIYLFARNFTWVLKLCEPHIKSCLVAIILIALIFFLFRKCRNKDYKESKQEKDEMIMRNS
jgi:hypothetical protein